MGVIWIICAYLFVFADQLNIPAEVGPSVMLLIFPAIFFIPLPIFYHRSRFWLIRILVSLCGQCCKMHTIVFDRQFSVYSVMSNVL